MKSKGQPETMLEPASDSLASFHPLLRRWFLSRYKAPTEIQTLAWPRIAKGEHLLLTAPTGNGKTLTAFLMAINNLVTGVYPPGQVSVLYISPLKALNNDIRRNLLSPLRELEEQFKEAGEPFQPPQVATRSGDTPQSERRRMLRNPPEILVTTPESLNLLLASPRARSLLSSLRTVILDEIHAVAGNKRGTYLISAVERLIPLCGEFQRIALSATITPLETIAEFVGGYHLIEKGTEISYRKRDVTILKGGGKKEIDLRVIFPPEARQNLVDNSWWPAVVDQLKKIILKNRSTLIFTNNRAHCEKLTRWINTGEPQRLAYAHHGSLSKEIRREVEKQLKAGELAAIVATSSLELGIDIGDLDEVVLIQTPYSLSSALQRIGRAGHGVGQISKGLLIPLHGRDFLEAAVMVSSLAEGEIEPTKPIQAPLDILAQIILAMTAIRPWKPEKLFAFLKTISPYHALEECSFKMVLNMLRGLYAETKIRDLAPRLSLDSQDGTLSARQGTLPLLYQSGGTIPDRGYFELRLEGSQVKIGELDEEFVWERRVGHSFSMGSQAWKIVAIDERKVQVVPWQGALTIMPFWKAEAFQGSFFFAEKASLFLETWNSRLDSRQFLQTLGQLHHMEPEAAEELQSYLLRQRRISGCDLPHRHHLLIENFFDINRKEAPRMIIFHTLWGGRVNFPFVLALSAWLEDKWGHKPDFFSDNNCVMLLIPEDFSWKDLLADLEEWDLETLIRAKLETTGYFGARFRENAGRALLLPRGGFGKRVPLWLNRLRGRKLLESILSYKDFPILAETWRGCVQEDFDLPALRKLLGELVTGKIRCTEIKTTTPTPFASNLIWRQTNTHLYGDDTPQGGRTSNLGEDIFRDVIFTAELRPRLDPGLCADFSAKMTRTYPGYAPDSPRGVLDLIRDRQLLPRPEWETLMAAIRRDHKIDPAGLLGEINSQLLALKMGKEATEVICAVDTIPRLLKILGKKVDDLSWEAVDPALPHTPGQRKHILRFIAREIRREQEEPEALLSLYLSWLAYYGPIKPEQPRLVLGLDKNTADELLQNALETEELLYDHLLADCEESRICLRDNLEILLRLTRKKARPDLAPRPLAELPGFLLSRHFQTGPEDHQTGLQIHLEKLFGYPASAELWEKEIFPARIPAYRSHWLDSLCSESDLFWFGCGRRKISFALTSDNELFLPSVKNGPSSLLPHPRGHFNFWEMKEHTGLESGALTSAIWEEVWQGHLSNTSLQVLRQGLANRFKTESVTSSSLSHNQGKRRSHFHTWKAAQPTSGRWYAPGPEPDGDASPLYTAELERDCLRQLLLRYSLLFKELLEQELPHLTWGSLFKALQIMELSGEVVSGYFFEGIPGIQFLEPVSLSLLSALPDKERIYWLNACDPLSLCGRHLPFSSPLPPRLPSNHLVYHGTKLVLISHKQGRNLEFLVPPDAQAGPLYLQFFRILLEREQQPLKYIKIEEINAQPVTESPYKHMCHKAGFKAGYRCLELRKEYT